MSLRFGPLSSAPFPQDRVLFTPLLIPLLLVKKDVPSILRGGLNTKPQTGFESLIGKTAVVVEDLTPEGLVKLEGEVWSAKWVNGTAERGGEVVVIGVSGAKVLVERRA